MVDMRTYDANHVFSHSYLLVRLYHPYEVVKGEVAVVCKHLSLSGITSQFT